MKVWLSILIASVAILFIACSNDTIEERVAVEDIKELVNKYSGNNTIDETASITSTELIVTDKDDNEIIYRLPEDEFFVSIAPYINETHP